MNKSQVIMSCSVALCVMLLMTELASSAPSNYDYDSVRDLYEVLLQREALADSLLNHRIVRKNNRSPSLRLRFGRRSDPLLYSQGEHSLDHALTDNLGEN
ncbi:short neuropeptide F precursor [Lycorma delicatula]|uniref:short neuropeptide F precursor n=1 Tax=Lycorma delicatula TaxID=130591 RepID=UPI003F51904A